MINLAAWFYRKLLNPNQIIQKPQFYKTQLLTEEHIYESNVTLKEDLRPAWLEKSTLYNNCDGSGADKHKNIAVYKAISEALERYAFYYSIDSDPKKFGFDFHPTTTGMAAFPYLNTNPARKNAKAEAIERWAIHNFNFSILPVVKLQSTDPSLEKFEILTPFNEYKVVLLTYNQNDLYCYGFAAGIDYVSSEKRALYELDRNRRILKRRKSDFGIIEASAYVDKTLLFFASAEGKSKFDELVFKAPKTIKNQNPKVLCDLEMIGPWSEYTKVWRYLLEDSYFDCSKDHTFFMF